MPHNPAGRQKCWNLARKDWDPEPALIKYLDKTTKGVAKVETDQQPNLPLFRAMIFRLRHLTPGYFRLLQMQLANGPESEPQDRLVNQLALLLAIMGLSLSYYSARQMSEEIKAQPEP